MPNRFGTEQIARQFNLERILDIFHNPQAHPKEVVMLVGIVLVLILIVLTLVALLFVKTPGHERRPRKKLTKGNFLVLTLVTLEVFVVTTIAVITAFSIYTHQPVFCRNCHQTEKSYRSWRKSTHAKISCMRCHQVPGVFGYTLEKAEAIRMVSAARSKAYEKPIVAEISNRACLQCHKQETSETIARLGIRVRHSDFLKKGYLCTQCHNTVGHKGRVTNAKYPSMDLCAACHNNEQASAKCGLCHVSDIGQSKRAGRRMAFPQAASSLSPTPCNRCHATEKCNRCHGLEMPHPPEWTERATHAREAAWEKKEVCNKCHDVEFCNECHNFPGHDLNFKQEHGKIATKETQEGCRGCHNRLGSNNDYCGLCHP